jgi:hypothetical protein
VVDLSINLMAVRCLRIRPTEVDRLFQSQIASSPRADSTNVYVVQEYHVAHAGELLLGITERNQAKILAVKRRTGLSVVAAERSKDDVETHSRPESSPITCWSSLVGKSMPRNR